MGLPIPIGPHKGTGAVERFHIAEPKGSTSVRDRSMSRRLVPAASKSTYALCSGSLIRKIELGWGDVRLKYDPGRYMLTMGRKQEPLCK